jgi:hypothetical protein
MIWLLLAQLLTLRISPGPIVFGPVTITVDTRTVRGTIGEVCITWDTARQSLERHRSCWNAEEQPHLVQRVFRTMPPATWEIEGSIDGVRQVRAALRIVCSEKGNTGNKPICDELLEEEP